MLEYLYVKFPKGRKKLDRAVLIDGIPNGKTNSVLTLERGEYKVSIEGDGFSPTSHDVVLTGTSVKKPKRVEFSLKEKKHVP